MERDPCGGRPVTGRTAPEAVSFCHLEPGPGRLLVKAGMLYAGPQVPQDRLTGQPDNQISWTIGRGPVSEQAGQVRVKQQGPAPATLAAAGQQGAGSKVYVPPLQATVSPTRSPARHMISVATRARRSPRATRESSSRSVSGGGKLCHVGGLTD